MASPRQGRQPQPTVFAEIDRSNAITKDIRDCVNFGPTGLPYNAGNRKLGSFTGAPSRSARSWGAGWLSATGKYPRVPRVAGLIGAWDVTIRCVWVQDSLTSFVVPFSCGAESVYNAAGATFISVDASGNLDGYCRLGGIVFNLGTLGVTAGTLNDFVLRRNWRGSEVNSVIELFLNGVLKFTYGTGGGSAGSTEATADWIFGKAESFTDLPGTVLQFQTWARGLTNGEINSLNSDKWQLFGAQPRAVFFAPAAGGTTHTTTGALTGPGSTVAGTAAHLTLHTSTGVLTGPGSAVAGTAAHQHATAGVLTGAGSAVAGTAAHATLHTSTGVLTGAGSTVVGAAAHEHAATGVLTGAGSVIVGTADRATTGQHPSTGALTGPGSIVEGTAAHLTLHTSTGTLIGLGASVSGTATRLALHATSGILVGPGSSISGVALVPSVLPPAALAEMYGGGWRKRKKKEEEPTIEEMVEAVAEEPKGKEKIVALLPKKVRQELPDDMWEVSVDKLVKEVKDASDRVQKGVERLYEKRRQKDDDEAFMLLNL